MSACGLGRAERDCVLGLLLLLLGALFAFDLLLELLQQVLEALLDSARQVCGGRIVGMFVAEQGAMDDLVAVLLDELLENGLGKGSNALRATHEWQTVLACARLFVRLGWRVRLLLFLVQKVHRVAYGVHVGEEGLMVEDGRENLEQVEAGEDDLFGVGAHDQAGGLDQLADQSARDDLLVLDGERAQRQTRARLHLERAGQADHHQMNELIHRVYKQNTQVALKKWKSKSI